VLSASAIRLRTQTDVAVPTQRLVGVIEGLSEGGAAVPLAGLPGPDVEVGVEVDDAGWPPGPNVAQVMSVSRLVPPAKDDRDGPGQQQGGDEFPKVGLGRFQILAGDPHISKV
jgi:hypothetical protein